MSYSVKVIHTVQDCNPADWDALSGGRPFSSHGWYQFGETVLNKDQPIYILVSDQNQLIGRATLWLKTEDSLPVSSALASHAINFLFKRWPLLVCHSPLSSAAGLDLPDGPQRAEVLTLIQAEAQRQLQLTGASFLVFDYLSSDQAPEVAAVSPLHALSMAEPGTILNLRWDSLEDLIGGLSKNERNSYKRAVRKAKALGVTLKTFDQAPDIEAALGLIKQHDQAYKTPVIPWARRLLEHSQTTESFWIGAYIEDRLVGCELLLGDQGHWVATALGRDYEVPYVYFVMGYESIRQVIERGGTALRWGTGAYDYKQRLGFELENNQYVAFMARHGWVDWAAQRAMPFLLES